MTLPLVTGSNNPNRQVSVDAWNNLINDVNAVDEKFVGRPLLLADYAPVSTANAQAAIDALPAGGGDIIVASDWSAITPASLTIATDKAVRFILAGNGALPDDMPGMVVSQGELDHPHEGGLGASSRPGVGYVNAKVRHSVTTLQANQQDSIYYIEGNCLPPSAGSGMTTEFAGLRVNMRMVNGTESGAGVRGAHMTITGDGGNAKLRSIRAIAIGYNGHNGLVNGGVISATRTGLIPTSAGGDGIVQYASGDAGPYPNEDSVLHLTVGPGIRRVLQLGGQAGKERPQFGILQNGGTAALLPELAFLQMHGAGNGDLVRVYNDENSTTEIATWEKTGGILAPYFRSNIDTISLADNGEQSFTLAKTTGFLAVHQNNGSTSYALIYYRALSGSLAAVSISAGASVVVGTGALPVDDGAVKMDVYITANTLTIRNRLGATTSFSYTVL